MTRPPSNSDWLEQTLESTRRNVRQLEIDACRIRTDLARIEAANAAGGIAAPVGEVETDDVHETPLWMSALAAPTGLPDTGLPAPNGASGDALDWQPAAEFTPAGMEILIGAPPQVDAPLALESSPVSAIEPAIGEMSWLSGLVDRSRGIYRRVTSPMMASLVFHGAILFLTVTITVSAIDESREYAPTILHLGGEAAKETESFDVQQLADLGEAAGKDAGVESALFETVAAPSVDPIPINMLSADGPVSLGQVGLSNSIPTDLGTLMTGVGGVSADGQGAPTGLGTGNQRGRAGGNRTGGGRAGGRLDSTMFFGTEARGDRFVFVVDNSSSMKGGRLEMAIAELVKTVEGLSPRQNFYVIFVSDQTYPMFYPQKEPALIPATPANKKRLADWLPKAILASGKNRELMKAMDMAAALRPQAVYLLWDGDLRYSEKVRLDVLTHLTQPNEWKFIVHTLGMGITSLDSEQNLRTIAQAHGGVYRRIDLPVARTR